MLVLLFYLFRFAKLVRLLNAPHLPPRYARHLFALQEKVKNKVAVNKTAT